MYLIVLKSNYCKYTLNILHFKSDIILTESLLSLLIVVLKHI